MDRQEVRYHMLRGMSWTGTTLEGTPSINASLPTSNIPFQTSSDVPSIDQTLVVDTSSTISPGCSTGAPSVVVPQGDKPVRRKRGRPRKYGPDGTLLTQSPSVHLIPPEIPSVHLFPPETPSLHLFPPETKGKQQLASFGGLLSGAAETGFTPHVIIIAQGEDICTKLISFSHQEHRSICVLSANGGISTVTLRQPSTSGGSVKYEGNFEILYLSGSFVLDDSGGSIGRIGGLSVSFALPDARVIGGAVEGVLIAASPIQVIVGSFLYPMGSVQSAETSDLQPGCPADALPYQNLASTSSMGNWPSSMQTDLQTSDYVIDKIDFQ